MSVNIKFHSIKKFLKHKVDLLSHFWSKIVCLMSVVPSNILSQYRRQEHLANFVCLKWDKVGICYNHFIILNHFYNAFYSRDWYYLVFSSMIKTRHKDVAHHKNDKSNDCSAHSKPRDGIEKGWWCFYVNLTCYIR